MSATYVSPDQMELVLHGDCKCEAKHVTPVPTVCTLVVVARFTTTCGVDKLVCASSAAAMSAIIPDPRRTCTCGRGLLDDWVVRPV